MPSSKSRIFWQLSTAFFFLFSFSVFLPGQQPTADLSGLRWRMIGPFRGGRSIAVSGVEGDPNTYYFGSVGGGVWKTNDGGITWKPIFDSQPIGSIGALAVAPSDSKVIYVGTGEADLRSDLTYGDGVYKSTDAGNSWSHIGLRETRHISRIVVDPHNPSIVLVAALGHAYGPNPDRGVFRSTDGGTTWQKVLYKDENTGAIDVQFDPDNTQNVYAALWSVHRPPWSTYPPIGGSGAIYKSTDGGASWKQISGNGLPHEEDWGRVGLAIARGTHGRRVYALVDSKHGGLFSSDDGGAHWSLAGNDRRIMGRLWYFGEVDVDPKDPNIVYLPNVSIYRSSDGGKKIEAFKGAPGGDDYHALWIDPANPQRMIFGSDQGVGISVNGGQTWSSWYNQPTAQFYHVAVDNQFPYRVYGAQQDSGSVSTASRSDLGSITFRDWYTVGAGESGYIAPDPIDPNIVYGGDTYGSVHRFDHRTGQSQTISPLAVANFLTEISHAELRFTWTSPLVFSPQDPHVLYFGSQYLLRSNDRGMNWERISPDLTGSQPGTPTEGPTTTENAKARGYGVIYTIAPSPVAAGQIWAGSDTGLIQLTLDGGKTWANVTPPGLNDWSKISLIEASHFDPGTAYAAVDRHRLNDASPQIFRTHDFGKTWTRIAQGIPDGAYVRAVREDPVHKGLLFAGTELGVYFSLNDGASWQSLQLNLPVTPVHDLVVKNNDLVVATHGRSFWILDDISPLRQMPVNDAGAYLFAPSDAIRMRFNANTDTPLPAEVPAGENPPAGAILYYYLNRSLQDEVVLEILDQSGKLVRRYSSNDYPAEPQPGSVAFPMYWFRPAQKLSSEAGLHRFIWNLRYIDPTVPQAEYSMATAFGQNTSVEAKGPQVLPGTYSVRLTAAGKTVTQNLTVNMDPRITTSTDDLQKQFVLAMKIYDALRAANETIVKIREFYAHSKGNAAMSQKLEALAHIEPETPEGGRRSAAPGGSQSPTISRITGELQGLAATVDSADAAPTTQATKAVDDTIKQLQSLTEQWEALQRSK